MSSENDKPSPVRVHIVVAGKEADGCDDVHYCGKCKLVFTDIKDYVEHKVSHDEYQLSYTRSEQDRRTLVPTLVHKKNARKESTTPDHKISRGGEDNIIKRRGKRMYVDESLITEKVLYSCMKCNKGFHRIAALKRHLEYDHQVEDPLLEDLDEAEHLQVAQPISTSNNNNDCVQAVVGEAGETILVNDEDYRPVAKRDRRKVAEKADRSHTCEVCGNKFKEANVLKSHLLTHTDQRDFICSVDGCGYAFKTKGSLKRHERRHTGEKPYPCKLCGRNFSESGALTRHMKSRTPCTAKSDTDLPRYGKRWGFEGSVDIRCRTGISLSRETSYIEESSFANMPSENSSTPNSPANTNSGANSPSKSTLVENSPSKNSSVMSVGNSPTKSASAGNSQMESESRAEDEEIVTGVGDSSTGQPLTDPASSPSVPSAEEDGSEIQEEADEALRQEEGTIEYTQELVCTDDSDVDNSQDLSDTTIITVHDWPSNFCRVCRLDYETEEELKLHLKLHLADTPFRCEMCHFVAEKQDDLLLHMQSIHGMPMKAYLGTACSQEYKGDEAEACQDHSKVLRDAKVAVQQLLELQGEPGEVRHSPSIHGDKPVYSCPICTRTFRGQSYVNQHMKSHTGERPHRCVICEKTFTCKDTLTKHVLVHSSERQYKCGECGKLFKRISHVREHLKIHSGERPFQCHLCNKTFKTLNASKVHARIHSTVLPYECTFCHRHFREKGSLQRHIRMHTGEKPFKCHMCDRAFAEHGTLSRHLKAKVPCARHLAVTSQAEGGFPTVLAEFSSVVADTQHYIVPDHMDDSGRLHQQEGTEYVVVHTSEVPVETLENVEIIATGEDGESMILNATGVEDGSAQYVVVSEADHNLRVFDSRTGQTVAMMPAHVVNDSDVHEVAMQFDRNQIEAVAMNPEGNQIEALAMNPESNQIEAIAMKSESSPIEVIAMNPEGNQIELVAMNPEGNQIESLVMDFDGNRVEAVAMNPEDRQVEPVDIMENIHLNRTGTMGAETMQQAIVAANAMKNCTETMTVSTEIEMEGETVSST